MSTIDPTVARILDKGVDGDDDGSDKEDQLLEELENDSAALDAFREKRMQQLHDEYFYPTPHTPHPTPFLGLATE